MSETHNEDAQHGIRISRNLELVFNKTRTEVSINRADGTGTCYIDIEVVDGKLELVYHDRGQADV
jgi:hypothetical protein